MKVAWLLARHIALWAAAFPVLGYVGALVERSFYPALATAVWPALLAWALLLAWAIWIYIRCVPSRTKLLPRTAYLALYIIAMGAVAYCALSVAVALVAVTFGV